MCRGGEVFVFGSDLGGGKTTCVKGLVKGLGSQDTVTSPSFTINQVYAGRDDVQIHHFDFYRLNQAGVVAYEIAEVLDDPKAVVVIEWADIIEDVLPPRRVLITIERLASAENDRLITVKLPKSLDYLAGATS